jgi:hypothetical protein
MSGGSVDLIDAIRREISPHLSTLAEIEHAAEGDAEQGLQHLAAFVATLMRDGATCTELAAITARLASIEKTMEDKIMSGLTDLQANITAMQAEWTTFLSDLTTALGNEDSDAAVEAAAQLVAQQTTAMQAADPITGTSATTPATTPAAS